MTKWDRLYQFVLHRLDRPGFPIFLGFMALLDHFVVVIPTDGLLVASVMGKPKRWIQFSLGLAVGSTLGAVLLAWAVHLWGNDFIEFLIPGVHQTSIWIHTDRWIEEWGVWALFATAALPLMQHPAIALSALAGVPLVKIAVVILSGRLLKYFVFGWLASHAPAKLHRFKSLKKEMKNLDLKLK